ncbi:hypothetical protein H9W91_07460 [Streptomyces alfalfae]|uniref:hypothetical protein n=1 Tax=Streptomyces alfalfae TaxID=1642299 RepID=UPI001BAA8163|nr:hypothetical protein [Streptomyces alfalfae]QUI30714.1 hypothetical protein H9W91_07460 [Streptomyces alfalfae]
MPEFWNLRRIRAYLALQRRFERYDAVDAMVEEMGGADMPPQGAYLSISAFGFRASAGGETGFAALKAIREKHPIVVRTLYTYLSVMAVLVTLALASSLPR